MTMSIRANSASLVAARSLNDNSASLALVSQRLASGLRINNASDDPAGLAISSLMSSKVSGLMQDQQNIGQGISLAQIIDGTLEQQNKILQRLATLAAESANGVLTNAQRASTIQPEVTSLLSQFDKIGYSAAFNGLAVLSGGTTGAIATVNPGATQDSNLVTQATTTPNGSAIIALQSNLITSTDTVTMTLDAQGQTVLTWTSSAGLITTAKGSANLYSGSATGGTATLQTITYSNASGDVIATLTVQPGVSGLVPTDTSSAPGYFSFNSTNSGSTTPLAAGTVNQFIIQYGTENNANSELVITVPESLKRDYGLTGLSMVTQSLAQVAITTVSTAISSIATVRASIGATISQLNQAEEFVAGSLINAQTALCQITDLDIASASADLAAQSVLVKAATAMLEQANKQSEIILTLLR